MKKTGILSILLMIALVSCGVRSESTDNAISDSRDYSGTYTGFSWQGEAKGVTLDEAGQKIETVLTLDASGTITDASIRFLVKNSDGTWKERNDSSAAVQVDFSVTPVRSIPDPYEPGKSQFSIKTADMMSFYAAAVNSDGTVAFGLVDPIHRYLSEVKLETGFDYSRKVTDLTIGSGLLIPTIRTSGSGYLKPKTWDEYGDKHLFGFYTSPYVYVSRGTFEGLGANSTVKDLLEKAGIRFENNTPVPSEPVYGFYANGGWNGNYAAMRRFLLGKKATELTSLIDWSTPRYAANINEDKFFGMDTVSGATRTVQNSTDGIAGATVRITREATSYQRALVAAGIIDESDVIKGRF